MTTEVFTVAQAMERVGVSRQTVLAWIYKGKIAAHKSHGDNGVWLIPVEQVEAKRDERKTHLSEELAKLQI